MAFAVKARVLLELGAELISSDAIALYELIKNSIDAGSKRIDVKVNVTLNCSDYQRLQNLVDPRDAAALTAPELEQLLNECFEDAAPAHERHKFLEMVRGATTQEKLAQALREAYMATTWVEVSDKGDGMSLNDLNSVYLTIGTTARLDEKIALFKTLRAKDQAETPQAEHDRTKVPLGEKGIGRLAAMRLGDFLEVKSSKEGERTWNLLTVDWAAIKADLSQDLSSLKANAVTGDSKSPSERGTSVIVRNLVSDWSVQKLGTLTRTDFAKLYDPFVTGAKREHIRFKYNGSDVNPTIFERELLDYADAKCDGEFRYEDGQAVLSGTVTYSLYNKTKAFKLSGIHLETLIQSEQARPKAKRHDNEDNKKVGFTNEELVEALSTLGPFAWEFHWYNRGRHRRENYEFWEARLGDFVALWSGGLLVYRDGYRVYPYADPEDDWLDLDRHALAAGAYKLNRAQIIGRVKISSRLNSKLQDQTNREGFRECPEKELLVRALRHVVLKEVRPFLERVNDELKPVDKDDLSNIERRLESSSKEAIRRVNDLGKRVPTERETINKLLDYLRDVTNAWERAKEMAATYESDLERYLHLAGIGLMVEFIAHELVRATNNALQTLENRELKAKNPLTPTLETLHAQLKTIEKRLRVLDPLSVPGRQRRSLVDVRSIAKEVLEAHEAQFQRHGITVKQVDDGQPFTYKVEKGQMIQILENLISNSVYWMREKQMRDSKYKPIITVRFSGSTLAFHDNGPGIPEDRGDDVFTPFVTTKPPGRGRGLGLHIARRLAEYNDAELLLDDVEKDGMHRTFLLKF